MITTTERVPAIKNVQRSDVELSCDPVEDTTDLNFDMDADESLRTEVRGLVHRIYEHTPDGSVIRGTFRKVKNGYKFVIKIVHSGGQMIAEGIQKTTDESLQVLESKLWGKIRLWRKNRFRSDETLEIG